MWVFLYKPPPYIALSCILQDVWRVAPEIPGTHSVHQELSSCQTNTNKQCSLYIPEIVRKCNSDAVVLETGPALAWWCPVQLCVFAPLNDLLLLLCVFPHHDPLTVPLRSQNRSVSHISFVL